MTNRLRPAAALAATLALAAVPAVADDADATVVTVTEDQQAGWFVARDANNAVPFAFEDGVASIGTGSLTTPPIVNTSGAEKFIAELVLGVPTTDFALSADFLVDAAADPVPAQQFYVNVYTNLPGSSEFYDCRYDYVADTGSTTAFTTLVASGTADGVRDRTGSGLCGDDATDLPAGSTVSFVSLNVGDTSLSDEGVGGAWDNVVVTTVDGTTVYDFEAPVTTKDDCKDDGWVALGYRNQGQCVSDVMTG